MPWITVNKNGKTFFEPNLQHFQLEQDGWKTRIFFRKYKLNMNLQLAVKYLENLVIEKI